MGSSRTRDGTRVPCVGRQILNHCATREVPAVILNSVLREGLAGNKNMKDERSEPCGLCNVPGRGHGKNGGPEVRGSEEGGGQGLQGQLCRALSRARDSPGVGARPLQVMSDFPLLPGSNLFHHRFIKVDPGSDSPPAQRERGPGLCEGRGLNGGGCGRREQLS